MDISKKLHRPLRLQILRKMEHKNEKDQKKPVYFLIGTILLILGFMFLSNILFSSGPLPKEYFQLLATLSGILMILGFIAVVYGSST